MEIERNQGNLPDNTDWEKLTYQEKLEQSWETDTLFLAQRQETALLEAGYEYAGNLLRANPQPSVM